MWRFLLNKEILTEFSASQRLFTNKYKNKNNIEKTLRKTEK